MADSHNWLIDELFVPLLAFLETVRDEVRYAADAKRQQLARGYSNDTLASMVRGIKWAEASQRVAEMSNLPTDAVEQVADVLGRELSVGTLEQIDELFTPAVRNLRDAWECSKSTELPDEAIPAESDGPIPIAETESGSVLLFDRYDKPIVYGNEKPTLTNAQYDVVLALLQTGDKGLTKDELDRESRRGDARKILKRLSDGDSDWQSVISFPGTTGKGYRII